MMMTLAKGKQEVKRLLLKEAPSGEQSPQQLSFAVNYLSFFGYLSVELLKNLDPEDVRKAVRTFQRWFGLKSDAVVGPKTLRAMEMPRCGCPDQLDPANNVHKQYLRMQEVAEKNMAKWNKDGLTYAIHQHVSGISKKEQEAVYAAAFKSWMDICGLRVSKINRVDQADLVISVGSGRRHNFDGRGGTLAWAYLPNGQGQQLLMRFDLAETWTLSPNQRGVLLFNVAAHEFGHMFGLTHSKIKAALMAPNYNPVVDVPQWNDDIPRMQARYGKPVAVPPTAPTNPPTPGKDEEIFHVECRDLRVRDYSLFASGRK